ncbi:MAG: gamma-glutamyltransferase [Gammaproteobacteria bacterium]|nr:gamma-glutamyltransferase [Gammaproteobacteria bacterium]
MSRGYENENDYLNGLLNYIIRIKKDPDVTLLLNQLRIFTVIFIFLLGIFTSIVQGQEIAILNPEDIYHPIVAKNGMVASQQTYATKAGLEVLKEGGNAIDAAVTVAFTLAVTLPQAGNIGGGGFMMIYLAKSGEIVALDYREKAPKAATRDMFLDKNGEVDLEKSRYSLLAVGVPGTVAGLCAALEEYGSITLERALRPAIELAEKGFPVDMSLRDSLIKVRNRMKASSASMEIFYKKNGLPYDVGAQLIQKDLANSLKLIAKNGIDAFYKGPIAEKIVKFMKENGGILTIEDMKSYQPVIRKPLHGTYRGYDIYSIPPPSSGGVNLIQMLNLLEAYPLGMLGHNTATTIHLMAESMKLAYADRSKYLGDPDFVSIPIAGLISKSYADKLRTKINFNVATPSNRIYPGSPQQFTESKETTHFSIIDPTFTTS